LKGSILLKADPKYGNSISDQYLNKSSANFISEFSALFLIMSIVMKDIITTIMSLSASNNIILSATIFCFVSALIGRKNSNMSPPIFTFFFFIFCYTTSFVYNFTVLGRFNQSPFFIGFIFAFILSMTGSRRVPFYIAALLPANLALQVYEQITGSLIFPTISRSLNFELDASAFSIGEEAIRTKGFFQGPLHIVSISMLALAFFPKSFFLHFCFVLCTYLAAARLGFIVSIFYLVYFLIFNSKKFRSILIYSMLFFIIVALVHYFIYPLIDVERLDFIALAFNFTNNASNNARIDAWIASVEMYRSYDFLSILFGRYNDIRLLTKQMSTESDWLRLLVDNGIFTTLLYLFSIVQMLYIRIKYKVGAPVFYIASLATVMSVYPSIGWLLASMVFWYLYFSHVHLARAARFNKHYKEQ
jgi:hypothetical protein